MLSLTLTITVTATKTLTLSGFILTLTPTIPMYNQYRPLDPNSNCISNQLNQLILVTKYLSRFHPNLNFNYTNVQSI